MGKKRKRNRVKHADRQTAEKAAEKSAEKSRSSRKLILKAGAFLGGLIGLLDALSTFLPRLSMSQFSETNPDSALSVKFQLANDSVIPLYNMAYRFWMPVVFAREPDRKPPPKEALEDKIETRAFDEIGTLNPGEKITISNFGFNELDPKNDITVVLEFEFSYRPAFSLWRVHKRIRMVSILDRDGKICWVQHPLGDLNYLGRGRPIVHEIPIPLKSLEKDFPGKSVKSAEVRLYSTNGEFRTVPLERRREPVSRDRH